MDAPPAEPAASLGLRAGAALFRARSGLPVPLLVAQLVFAPAGAWWPVGAAVLALGQGIRLWAVGHIGGVSRTRDAQVGPLVDTGPYGRCRNPLYVGNVLMWVGVGLVSGPLWAAAWLLMMAVEYTLIVRWEESRLRAERGEAYLAYIASVPRWVPTGTPRPGGRWSAATALSSERSTLIAVTVVATALVARAYLAG